MKIAVIGAGIVGICTAFELAQDGHDVLLFERNASVAQEASFACAGHLSPSLSHPLALPTWPHGAWLRAVAARSAFSVGKGCSLSDLRWLMGWKAPGKQFSETLAAAFGLTSYSLEHLHKCAVQNALVYERSQGNLLLWQSEAEVAQHQTKLLALKELGLVAQVLTVAEARAMEPALQQDYNFQSATYFPSDEIGNCRQYAHSLKGKLSQLGVQLYFDTSVSAVSKGTGIQVHTLSGEAHGVDHVVVCTGTGTNKIELPVAHQLPLTTVWSYSLSAPIREPLNAPRSAVQDCQNLVTISRLGGRLRVAGGAELGARKRPNDDSTIRRLYRSLSTLFPGAADYSRNAQVWKGASQFTPDGLPVVGPSAIPGIWFNAGHGQNGWAMAAGSARILADLVAGKPAEIDVWKLRPERFKK